MLIIHALAAYHENIVFEYENYPTRFNCERNLELVHMEKVILVSKKTFRQAEMKT